MSAAIVQARVDPAGNAQSIYLSGKAVSHGIHRVSLVGLDFEFKFHVTPSVFCMRSAFILQTGTVSPPVNSTCNPLLVKTFTELFALQIIMHADIFILPFI